MKKLFESGAKIYIRIPVISGVNDMVSEMQKIKSFLAPYHPEKIELLPYHKMGTHKYDALGMEEHKFIVSDESVIKRLDSLFTTVLLER